ncbi:ubiquitin-related modifier 1 homolog isoform X2 [Rhipicephalus sanguineus]|uniref:ubiquitin-related modifier 1 homolog isoform X2 n=1 Tax=Rhipicephalus sanguineus TaxID=34632 RepID=UPI0020C48FB9|nr:ubiquitin-related modifier 1 homolog isoform X2 [Rhipicephalus sanguineus]
MTNAMTNQIHLRVEFGGGAELLFGNQKKHDVAVRSGHEKCTLSDLIMWLKTNLLRGKEELFVQGNTVRPGILVLVNDTDWELQGGLDCEVKPNDTVLFISTLHGG